MKTGFPLVSVCVLAAALAQAGCAGGVGEIAEPAVMASTHPFPVREASPGHHAHEVHGIDVAKYQGEIDWQAVKAAGVGFAFIKATEGADRMDDRFQANWAGARAAGIPRGAYHFSYWCTPMEQQFEAFRRVVPVEPDAMPPVLDLEWNFQSPTCPRKVDKAHALAEVRKFLRLAEAHYRKKPIIYVEIPFYRDILADGELSEYPIWVRSVAAPPQARYPGRRWAFWQYSAKGRVPGIKPLVDRNVFAGSRSEWRRLVASNFQHGHGGHVPVLSAPVAAPVTAVAAVAAGSAAAPALALAAVQPAEKNPPDASGVRAEVSGGEQALPAGKTEAASENIPLPPVREAGR